MPFSRLPARENRCYPDASPAPRMSAWDPPSMLSPEATSQERRLLHKAAVVLLAVPILFAVYLGALLRRSVVSRIGLALAIGGLLGVGVIGAGLPAATSAR